MKNAGMPEKPEGPKKLPAFSSLDELVRFVDENDVGDYLDVMPEAHFDVNLKSAYVSSESCMRSSTKSRAGRTSRRRISSTNGSGRS